MEYSELLIILKEERRQFCTVAFDPYISNLVHLADNLTEDEKTKIKDDGGDPDSIKRIHFYIGTCLDSAVKARVPPKSQFFTYRFTHWDNQRMHLKLTTKRRYLMFLKDKSNEKVIEVVKQQYTERLRRKKNLTAEKAQWMIETDAETIEDLHQQIQKSLLSVNDNTPL